MASGSRVVLPAAAPSVAPAPGPRLSPGARLLAGARALPSAIRTAGAAALQSPQRLYATLASSRRRLRDPAASPEARAPRAARMLRGELEEAAGESLRGGPVREAPPAVAPAAFLGHEQPPPPQRPAVLYAPLDGDALEQELVGAAAQFFVNYRPEAALPASTAHGLVAALSTAFCSPAGGRQPICGPGTFAKTVAGFVAGRLLAAQEDFLRALPGSVAARARSLLRAEMDGFLRRCADAEASVGQLRASLGAAASAVDLARESVMGLALSPEPRNAFLRLFGALAADSSLTAVMRHMLADPSLVDMPLNDTVTVAELCRDLLPAVTWAARAKDYLLQRWAVVERGLDKARSTRNPFAGCFGGGFGQAGGGGGGAGESHWPERARGGPPAARALPQPPLGAGARGEPPAAQNRAPSGAATALAARLQLRIPPGRDRLRYEDAVRAQLRLLGLPGADGVSMQRLRQMPGWDNICQLSLVGACAGCQRQHKALEEFAREFAVRFEAQG